MYTLYNIQVKIKMKFKVIFLNVVYIKQYTGIIIRHIVDLKRDLLHYWFSR